MKRTWERGLALFSVILTAVFLASAVDGGRTLFGGGSRESQKARYFHGGKTAPAFVGEPGCRSPGCHVGMPHRKDRTQAAFRNMHLRIVDCLVCHGRDSRKSWAVEPPPAASRAVAAGASRVNRWTIIARTRAADGKKMHELLGTALSCRGCHSEEGRREIAALGVKDIPPGFANPLTLRMVEEGAKQWIPDTLR